MVAPPTKVYDGAVRRRCYRRVMADPQKSDITLHQLRIFCAVAQSLTLTRAGKQLGLAQPTLSQQLAKLEETVGVKLFDRTLNQMKLTDAGRYLLRQTQFILNDVDQAQATLREFSAGIRGVIRLAGLNSVIRALLPRAMELLAATHPASEFDIHEVAPAEALELLYGRAVHIGLIAAQSVAASSLAFHRLPVIEDPYVLAVPAHLDLSAVEEVERDLGAADRELLRGCIQFNFGTAHSHRVAQWYQTMLPGHRLIAQCRSYEVAMAIVRAGKGVCLAPSLTAAEAGGRLDGLRLYATDQPPRRTMAVMPAHYLRVEPYKSFLACLQQAGGEAALPPVAATPPFIRKLAAAAGQAATG
jgi:DNA-binding transcriptional LysR family regulator